VWRIVGRSLLQTLLVSTVCGGAVDLLSGFDGGYQGSLAEARQPFAMVCNPFGVGGWRNAVEWWSCCGVMMLSE
jgi:hypothetical protein